MNADRWVGVALIALWLTYSAVHAWRKYRADTAPSAECGCHACDDVYGVRR